jgi:hypothetical protein
VDLKSLRGTLINFELVAGGTIVRRGMFSSIFDSEFHDQQKQSPILIGIVINPTKFCKSIDHETCHIEKLVLSQTFLEFNVQLPDKKYVNGERQRFIKMTHLCHVFIGRSKCEKMRLQLVQLLAGYLRGFLICKNRGKKKARWPLIWREEFHILKYNSPRRENLTQ